MRRGYPRKKKGRGTVTKKGGVKYQNSSEKEARGRGADFEYLRFCGRRTYLAGRQSLRPWSNYHRSTEQRVERLPQSVTQWATKDDPRVTKGGYFSWD